MVRQNIVFPFTWLLLLGVSRFGNDRTGNPFFRRLILMVCKVCRWRSNWCVHQAPGVLRLQSWRCRCLVCAVGASLGRLLLGGVTWTSRWTISPTSKCSLYSNICRELSPVIFALVETKCWAICIFPLIVAMALVGCVYKVIDCVLFIDVLVNIVILVSNLESNHLIILEVAIGLCVSLSVHD